MISIIEVKTKKDIKEFINFPLRLYKGCEYFVPPMYADEKKLLLSGGKSNTAESVFYLAKKDGKTVGRIQGIIQNQYNEMHNEKRVRFTRFDSIDDTEVSRALFGAVEAWAVSKGMDTVCGPLGFSDLDREGLLIEGFNENSTFEEQYSYEYYPKLLEDSGYGKEIDWFEFELRAPEKKNPMLERVAARALEFNKLHIADTNMSKKAYIDKYGDSFFECLDECYSKLYGTVPITPEERKEIISQFILIVNIEFAVFICDENDKVVAFGLCFPAIGDALKKSGGRLTLPAILKLLKLAKKPKVMDLGLVAVRPEYQNSGVNAVLVNGIADMLINGKVEKCETNLNLETNTAVIAQWKYFNARQHKKRRSYIKSLKGENNNA
ncbi:MAG: hypothetical protein E7673_03875 [Ruminococcaceae bacterium]|nr:hypothetical protein [Oscillospiraceae bacterium]